jgi:type I protein arginine methyltransferase
LNATLYEHLEYLSDARRTECFRHAIAEIVRPGDVIVDLGCGFGVLGLLCLEAGAAEVWGIDHSDAIEIAREAAERAGLEQRYHCLAVSTFRAALPVKADLLICDHVGYFGFDYGIAPMMTDALRLLKPEGRVLPGRIDLKLAGVAGPRLRSRIDRWNQEPVPGEFAWLRGYAANTKHNLSFKADEIQTGISDLGTINLDAPNGEHQAWTAALPVQAEGAIDGLGGWFDCSLSAETWMTNSPLASNRIGRDQAFLPVDPPLEVKPGDQLVAQVSARFDGTALAWTVENPRTGERRRHSTWRSQILSADDRNFKPDWIPRLGAIGQARRLILDLTNGTRRPGEIENAVIAACPDLFPSEEEIRRFVRTELQRNRR